MSEKDPEVNASVVDRIFDDTFSGIVADMENYTNKMGKRLNDLRRRMNREFCGTRKKTK